MDLLHPQAEAGLFAEFERTLRKFGDRVGLDITRWQSGTTNGKWRRMVVGYYLTELTAMRRYVEHLEQYVSEEDS